jgi:SET domain-containing protein
MENIQTQKITNETVEVPIFTPEDMKNMSAGQASEEFDKKAQQIYEQTIPNVEFFQASKIKIGKSFDVKMGMGVVATKDIEPGELVERCYMVPLAHRGRYQNDPQIKRYLYSNRCPCDQCMIHGGTMYMVLGYGMIYNHQDAPNTEWSFHWDRNYADIHCIKHIKTGEEVFVSYGPNYFKDRPYMSAETTDISSVESDQNKQKEVIET